MKLRKILSVLLAIAMVCVSMLSFAGAEPVNPNITLKAEVVGLDTYGWPIVGISVNGDSYERTMSGRTVSSATGASAVSVQLILSDNFVATAIDTDVFEENKPAGDAVVFNVSAPQTIEYQFSTTAAANYLIAAEPTDIMKFSVQPKTEGLTLDEYKALDLGDFTDYKVITSTYNKDTGNGDDVACGNYGDVAFDVSYIYVGNKTVLEPTAEPTATPTAEPTATPTAEPTATPTAEPTATPTAEPTATPTAEPTATPTAEPTATPTAEPTATPTAEPTATPTAEPADKVTVDDIATPVAADTAYWGVKILEAAEANITAKFETDTESKEVTLVNAAGLDGNGDLAFNLYLKLTGERVGKAVTATVTVGDDSDSGVWAAAN